MLENKIAVVTGSSSGIGRAIAIEFAAQGADVLIHANRNATGAKETAALIREKGRDSTVLLADFSDTAHCLKFCEDAWNWKGRVDLLVNNAGADVLTGSARDWTFEEKLDALFAVDVKATMQIARNIGDRMRKSTETGQAKTKSEPATLRSAAGVILNIGWDQAMHGMEGDSGEMFGAIKSAVIGFSKSLAISLAPYVRVNCLAPGWIRTSWGDQASEYWEQRAVSESLLDRWGQPQDVAKIAALLAGDDAGFLNGQIIPINGGFRRSGS